MIAAEKVTPSDHLHGPLRLRPHCLSLTEER
jgi:hypothetical protein